jgi:Dyp-type peroxidase family
MTTPDTKPASQSRAAIDLDDVQSLVAHPHNDLPVAKFALLRITDGESVRRWLRNHVDEIATARTRESGAQVNIAFTAPGLSALRFGATLPDGFSREFLEGIATAHRTRILGDEGTNAPQQWRWGGEGREVHVLLMVYACDGRMLDAEWAHWMEHAHGVEPVVEALASQHLPDSKEHFGFRDGVAQPCLRGLMAEGDPDNTIALGEALFGYANEYGRLPASPSIAAAEDPQGILHRGDGVADLGRNGTYLVLRQLAQDVHSFWQYLSGDRGLADAIRLGAKMVGRWPGGAPLVLAPDRDDPTLSSSDAFGYADADKLGNHCPIGSHIRRTNPRDALMTDPVESVKVVKRHRIVRRGRAYGPPVDPSMSPAAILGKPRDNIERGLLFMCLNANIGRQFEFIQQTWANSPKFGGLYGDVDPLFGQRTNEIAATFTEPGDPVRTRATGLPEFVTVKGGAYFFLPSIRALRFLVSG